MSAKKEDKKESVETPAKSDAEVKASEETNAMVDLQAEIKVLKEEKAAAEAETVKVAADAKAAADKVASKKVDPLHFPKGQETKKVKSTPAPKGKRHVRSVGADGKYRWDYV